MRQVLVIAYYFPPLGGIGSLRASSFATYLPDHGWEATVLAPAGGAYYQDPDLVVAEDRVVRSRSYELSRTGKRVLRAGGDDTRPAQPGVLHRTLQSAARRFIYYPDAQVGWYLPTVQAGRRTVREHSFDAIFSSAYPVTAHLVARRLHRETGIPWVAEYRDPFSELVSSDRLTQRRALRLERSIARESAAIVMTSPSWAQSQSEKWDRPVTVITNGCAGAVKARPADPHRFVLAHLGTLYPQRHDLKGAWRAIRGLSDGNGSGVDSLCFIGEPQAEVQDELDAQGLGPLVSVTGFVSSHEAIERMQAADALLLAGPKDAGALHRGWIPAKLFEYLATDLPIIYVGDPDCDAADLLRGRPGCYVLRPDDVSGIMTALRDCRGERHPRDVSGFTRAGLTKTLAEVLEHASLAAPTQ